MASPVDTFKNNLFGQLKSYGDAVQGVFEQRIGKLRVWYYIVLILIFNSHEKILIKNTQYFQSFLFFCFFLARPLLALKRDFSRSSSTTRTPSDQEPISPTQQTSFITHEEILSASTPLEIIDIETNDAFKTIIDKFKDTFSPTTQRRTSDFSIDKTKKSSREHRHSSISSLSNKTHRNGRLRHFKSVSFADNIQYDNNNFSPCLLDQQQESIDHTNIMESINEKNLPITSSFEDIDDDEDDNNFQRHFYQAIKPRRISIGNGKDLVYQDLSAEIVGYVLKHALRTLEKEDEDFLLAQEQNLINNDEDFIDLK